MTNVTTKLGLALVVALAVGNTVGCGVQAECPAGTRRLTVQAQNNSVGTDEEWDACTDDKPCTIDADCPHAFGCGPKSHLCVWDTVTPVTPPSGTAGCGVGLTNCGGQCINLTTAANNCGACGTVCESGQVCNNGVCTSQGTGGSTCTNGVKDGNETDIDCGGGGCGQCGNGKTCKVNTDCQNGTCTSGVCANVFVCTGVSEIPVSGDTPAWWAGGANNPLVVMSVSTDASGFVIPNPLVGGCSAVSVGVSGVKHTPTQCRGTWLNGTPQGWTGPGCPRMISGDPGCPYDANCPGVPNYTITLPNGSTKVCNGGVCQ